MFTKLGLVPNCYMVLPISFDVLRKIHKSLISLDIGFYFIYLFFEDLGLKDRVIAISRMQVLEDQVKIKKLPPACFIVHWAACFESKGRSRSRRTRFPVSPVGPILTRVKIWMAGQCFVHEKCV